MFNTTYLVVIEEDTRPGYIGGVSSNGFTDDNDMECIIIHYLEVFNYRKNVSYLTVAKHCDDYFFMEFVCAILRQGHKDEHYTPCNDNNYDCSPQRALKKSKKMMKRGFKEC